MQIVEYFIQWTLIYLTLYQFISNSISDYNFDMKTDSVYNLINVTTLNIALLPVMLISWVCIAMNKMNKVKEII